jgi:hypothetical protein
MRAVRTWLPVAIIAAGLIVIVAVRDENGIEGGGLLISAGLSVWLLNWFYRVSVRGERDRDVEDDARRFYDEHGYWPDEAPDAPQEASRPRDPHKHGDPEPRRPRTARPPRRPGT